jgi:hypothetical protein
LVQAENQDERIKGSPESKNAKNFTTDEHGLDGSKDCPIWRTEDFHRGDAEARRKRILPQMGADDAKPHGSAVQAGQVNADRK